MLLETFLVVGSCHDKPSTTDRVLHLVHEFRVFRKLETMSQTLQKMLTIWS